MICADKETRVARLKELAQEMTETSMIIQHKYPVKSRVLLEWAVTTARWVEEVQGEEVQGEESPAG